MIYILSVKVLILISIICNIIFYLSTETHCQEEIIFRQKRGVVFPPFTVLQFAIGLAVPAQVPNRSIFTNLGTLSNLPLPSKVTQLYPYSGKSRELTHNNFYKTLASTLNWYNLNGEECILKTICEVSKMNLKRNELIFDMLQLVFSPSTIKYPVAESHYMRAEQRGKSFKNCTEMYPFCTHSIINALIENVD